MAALYAVGGTIYIISVATISALSQAALPLAIGFALIYAIAKRYYGDPRARSFFVELPLYAVLSLGMMLAWVRVLHPSGNGDPLVGILYLGAALIHLIAVAIGAAAGTAWAVLAGRRGARRGQ